jgi:hypothetical protein
MGKTLRTTWALTATIALGWVLTNPGAARAIGTGSHAHVSASSLSAGRGPARSARADRRRPEAPPTTHTPAATPRQAVETSRDDGRARRRLPESRTPQTASRRSLWTDARNLTAGGDLLVAADAGLFHEANAPPPGPCAVAGRPS